MLSRPGALPSLRRDMASPRYWMVKGVKMVSRLSVFSRGDRGWLSHGLVVTLPISYSLDGGTLWGFTRDLCIAD